MWPEAIITYAKWGDTLGALSLTLEPLRRGVPLCAQRAARSRVRRRASRQPVAGPGRAGGKLGARPRAPPPTCGVSGATRPSAVRPWSRFRASLRLRVLSRRLVSCTT